MKRSGNNPIFNIPGALFWDIPQYFIGNFFRIFHEHIFAWWVKYKINREAAKISALLSGKIDGISYKQRYIAF